MCLVVWKLLDISLPRRSGVYIVKHQLSGSLCREDRNKPTNRYPEIGTTCDVTLCNAESSAQFVEERTQTLRAGTGLSRDTDSQIGLNRRGESENALLHFPRRGSGRNYGASKPLAIIGAFQNEKSLKRVGLSQAVCLRDSESHCRKLLSVHYTHRGTFTAGNDAHQNTS